MNILLVEDEYLAAQRLETLILKIAPQAKVLAVCDSIRQTVRWIQSNQKPDLAFFDIQLGDGLSFDIFSQIIVDFPVVFTTAYDQYAVKAFQVNGLDYLLKPVEEQDLIRALERFKKGQNSYDDTLMVALQKVASQIQNKEYKSRFLIKVGEHLKMVEVTDISFVYSQDKANFIRTFSGHNYSIDNSLEQIALQLNPDVFFRISRKYLVNADAIEDMLSYGVSRLKLKMKGMTADDEVLVSREKVKSFKEWLER